ncbi:MAG: LLM class F420-dependent oxidoreductase [Gammaproteobacteria bacterium]|nr:LLM class F420-dependent oxidoreductase [Gammaproteobacteria bacterium]
MKLGVVSFNTEYTIRADELATAAEVRGFDSVWFPEHTHIPASRLTPFPPGGDLPREYIHMSDPFISCMAAAGATKTLKVGTGVCLLVEHEPIALAKTVATLDRLSNGRFLFGIGAGWIKEEMENHGTPYARRWKVLEERIKAMKALWTEEEASFHGRYVDFDRVWSHPKPITKPHPPIILGTFASQWGRQRVADYADGWMPIDVYHQDLKADVADLHARLRARGRDPAAVPISMFDIFETKEDDLKRFADYGFVERAMPRCPTEDRDTVLRWLDRYAEIGRRVGAIA